MRSTISVPGFFPSRLSLASLASAASLAALVACGGSTAAPSIGSGSVSGTVDGITFDVASAFALSSPDGTSCSSGSDGGLSCVGNGELMYIVLTNLSGLTCQQIQTPGRYANVDEILLMLSSDEGALGAGTYTAYASSSGVPAGVTQVGASYFATTDSSCNEGYQVASSAGTITLTAVSASHAAGTYDITYGTSGHVTGSFDVDVCGDISNYTTVYADGGVPACR